MKHLKKFNEKGTLLHSSDYYREKEEQKRRQEKSELKGDPEQDVVHWEIVIENDKPYLKVATDDDYYYVKMKSQKTHDRED